MATATKPGRTLQSEKRFVLPDVTPQGYESLLQIVGDGHVRITYDGIDAELMSSSFDHEEFKKLIARLIETMTVELNLPCKGVGSTTWRKPLIDKGLEPDECYYLANARRILGRSINLGVDPPPDLAIEIEISRVSALDRMSIYAALGVPEVWRFDGERLTVELLQHDGTYHAVFQSPSFPFLPLDEFVRWIEKGQGVDQTPWIREFRDWVRDELGPHAKS